MVSPFQKLFHSSYKTVGQLWSGITELNYLKEELRLTRKNLEEYEEAAQSLTEMKNENDRLRRLLGFKDRVPFKVIPAEVIAKSPDNFFRILIINKGSTDGVEKYMPVVAYYNGEKAIVGKIIEVRWNISKVLPIIDGLSKIGATLQKSRFVGLLSGNAPIDDNLTMQYIDPNAPLEKNEMVVTSGEGGIFPRGLLIGRVMRFENFISGGFKKCIIKPHLEFGSIDQVLVIKKKIDEELSHFLNPEGKK